MNVEQLVRESLHEMSEQESPPAPPDFADRVLRVRRKRRVRTFAGVAMATAAAVLAAVTVPMLDGDDEKVRPADRIGTEDVHAHPDQSPPRELIAGGKTAMSAYTTSTSVDQPNGDVVVRKVWHLYNPSTGRYEKTDWAWADVAPGMDKAAVLVGPLPSKKIGILDLTTGEVERWIPLAHGTAAASVFWSPGGRRLLATTYSRNPDRRYADHPVRINGREEPGERQSRTGYAIIDVASGGGRWFELPYEQTESRLLGLSRSDLGWSADGSKVVEWTVGKPYYVYYDLEGNEVAPPGPAGMSYNPLSVSPDGRLLATGISGEGEERSTTVLDAETGEQVAEQPVQELLAWADDNRLFAWSCDPEKCNAKGRYRQRLVLVDMQGKQVVELTDYGSGWQPVFTSR